MIGWKDIKPEQNSFNFRISDSCDNCLYKAHRQVTFKNRDLETGPICTRHNLILPFYEGVIGTICDNYERNEIE